MNPPVALMANVNNDTADLPLRLAQRAFAALIEEPAGNAPNHAEFRFAQLRSAARRTLSALSADDHVLLTRWLALQFAAAATSSSQRLGRVDAVLAANVDSALEPMRERLFAGGAREVAAA
jgi:hypothetical protein